MGFGFIAENGHVPAYRTSDELEVVAVADICAARREAAARALPNARIYASHVELLERERGAIEFVDVTTPPYVHATVARAALEAGCHVLCEKPLTTTLDDARMLVALAESKRRVLFPSHNYKHAPVVRRVRSILASGALGRPHLATLSTFRTTHARGVAEWRESWRRERRFAGGGIAMDHGAHTFYLAFEWLGAHPTSITAKMTSSDGLDTEDTFSGTLTFPNGALAMVNLTWTSGFRKVIYTLHGEHGALRIEDDALELVTSEGTIRDTISSNWMDASHAGWFASLFRQLTHAIDARTWVGSETLDALRCVELVATAYASSRDGSRELVLPSAIRPRLAAGE
ncbi:MAG TPA: Gfo/Idh/MocA family oxidoreductase [Labilithrix sp.]